MSKHNGWAKYLAVLTPGLLLVPKSPLHAQAQCVTQCTDANGGHYTASQGISCFQPAPPDCVVGLVANGISFLNVRHPGLMLVSSDHGFLVSNVLEGSPAESAGILVGDRILSINGIPIDEGIEIPGWSSRDNPTLTDVTIARNGSTFTVPIKLVPVRELLRSAWRGRIAEAAYVSTDSFIGGPDSASRPFTMGIELRKSGSRLFVNAVMIGSPADRENVAVGDEVLIIDGHAANVVSYDALANYFDGFSPRSVTLTITNNGAERRIALTTEGLSSIVGRIKRPIAHPIESLASLR